MTKDVVNSTPGVDTGENKEASINTLASINAALVLLDANIVSFDDAAKTFSVSRQTLNNWLGESGTSKRKSPLSDDLRLRLVNCRVSADTPAHKLFGGVVFIRPMLDALKDDIAAWQKSGTRTSRKHSITISELRAFVVNTRLYVSLPDTWRKMKIETLIEAICKADDEYTPATIASSVRAVQNMMAAQAVEFAQAAKVAAKAVASQQPA